MDFTSSKKVLIIGLIWPEPTSSAAGYRMVQLIDWFLQQNYEVHFASAAQKSDRSYMFSNDVREHAIFLNEESFDIFVSELQPDVVMYDRFMVEEQYGWRVRQSCPNALTILDTEDLHFVRKAREKAYKKNKDVNYYTDDAKRELASIYRSDLSLIISKEEMKILDQFRIPDEKLLYLPFIEKSIESESATILADFETRADYCFIGNFIHEPNYQTVLVLKKTIWPLIRKRQPKAQLFVYGSYPSQKIWDLHNFSNGFHIIGAVDTVEEALCKHKVLIAPIPFGAGIKGKFVDAAKCGIPNVTSTVGAEGMYDAFWNGFVSDNDEEFADLCVYLYENEYTWKEKVDNGNKLLKSIYETSVYSDEFSDRLHKILTNISSHRALGFVGEILFQQQFQASKYMSLWIMEKNK